MIVVRNRTQPRRYPAMALTEQQFKRVSALLAGLKEHKNELTGNSANFVSDQITRHDRYAEDMFLSPRQMQWLEDLYMKHVGPLSDLPSDNTGLDVGDDEADSPPQRGRPLDDDIPF